MRVSIVHTRHRAPGGEDAVVHAEAQLLISAGHEVCVEDSMNPAGVAAAPVLLRAPWNRGAARTLVGRIMAFNADVAHVHNTWFAQSAAILPALRARKMPVVMTLHNYRMFCADGTLFRDGAICFDCVGRAPLGAIAHRCYRDSTLESAIAATTISVSRSRGAWDCVDRFVAPSELVRRVHIASGVDADRIVVKPHFAADPGGRPAAPSKSRTVVFVGRLTAEKGIAALVRAWSRSGPPGLELVIIGDGPARGACEAIAPPTVSFVGQLEPTAVRQHLLEARALVFPSAWLEPFGLVLIEALAAGCGVVGSDVGDTESIVGTAGCLAETDDLDALLCRLDDDGFVDALGSAGRERYLERFTPAANLPLLEAVYRDVRR